MLGAKLGGGGQLDPLRIAQRALREGREPAHRLDLVAEQLHPDRALLGRRVRVEDVAADRELAALLDLLDALVARLGQQRGNVREVNRLAQVQRQAVRPQLGIRDGLRQRHGAGDHDRRRAAGGERRDRGHPQPGQVRRRGHVGEVAGAARGIEVHAPGRQKGLQVGRHVPGRAVIGRDDQGRALPRPLAGVEQGGEQVGPERGRDVGLGRPLRERGGQRRQGVPAVGDL